MSEECNHIIGTYGDYGDYYILDIDTYKANGSDPKIMNEIFKYCPLCGEELQP